jgi:Na+-transporting NADH:ubiquinone oxidoreductase subunit NqrF
VKPESYIHKDQTDEVNSIFDQLKSLNSVKDLKKWFEENNVSKDVYDSYYKYITENEDIFFNVPTP